jgi:hypothetical protein
MDAHSTTSTFAVVDENDQCVLRDTVKTSEQSLVHVLNWPISSNGTTRLRVSEPPERQRRASYFSNNHQLTLLLTI